MSDPSVMAAWRGCIKKDSEAQNTLIGSWETVLDVYLGREGSPDPIYHVPGTGLESTQ